MRFLSLNEADVKGKVVILRVDINSPIDPKTGEILDDMRLRLCVPTIKELAAKGARTVILAHQGRPGEGDFTTLEKHAKRLSELAGLRVEFVPNPVCPFAIQRIRLMRPGEIILLDNIRFLSEEVAKLTPEQQAKTHMVKLLASVGSVFVNDAFGAAHRSSPSLVGLAEVLPAYMGRLMERELSSLGRALDPEHPCVYVLGGVKFDDSLRIIEHVLAKGIADAVLTGGLVANAFLTASGLDLGPANLEFMKSKGYEAQAEKAKGLLKDHGDKILIPADLVVDAEGQPQIVEIGVPIPSFTARELCDAVGRLGMPGVVTEHRIYDIGPKTVQKYAEVIRGAKTVVANGPLGMFERRGFEHGTYGVLKAMAESQAYTVIGGGHVVAAANAAGVAERLSHVSTGGGAAISFLSGEPLPVVRALERSAEKVGSSLKGA
jgi:phosphoglycerate kinase